MVSSLLTSKCIKSTAIVLKKFYVCDDDHMINDVGVCAFEFEGEFSLGDLR